MKIILMKKGERGLFLFQNDSSNAEFVVANFDCKEDLEKSVGDVVYSWHWGTYFQSLESAIECFNKN